MAIRAPRSVQTSKLRSVTEFKTNTAGGGWRSRDWQRDAYDFVRNIGELNYFVRLISNTVGACALQVVEDVGGDTNQPMDPRVTAALKALVPPRGGQKQLLKSAASNLVIGGESIFLGTPTVDPGTIPLDDSPEIVWEFLSAREVRIEMNGIRRDPTGSGSGRNWEFLHPDVTFVDRVWMPDPEFSGVASSSIRGVLNECRQLVLLRQVIDAAIKSRINAGILFIPEGLSFGTNRDDTVEPIEIDSVDEFIEELMEHMAAPLEDNASAASLVPLVVQGALGDNGEVPIKLIDIGRNVGEWAIELREEVLQAIGRGIDAPPEMLTGKANLNHWTGYSIDAEFNAKHVIPLGEFIAEYLTTTYLRPLLINFEGMTPEQAGRYSIVFDPSAITARADKGVTALQLWDRGLISDRSVVLANGFGEEDMPTDQEKLERFLLKLVEANPASLADAGQHIEFLTSYVESVSARRREAISRSRPSSAPVEDAPAPPPDSMDPESGGGEPPAPGADAVARILGACHTAVASALTRAGSRIVSKMARRPDVRERYLGVPKSKLLATITDEDLEAIGETVDALMAGAWDGLYTDLTRWIDVELRGDIETARFAAQSICENLTALVERDRGRVVYEGGTLVPFEMLEECLALPVAG